MRHAALQGVWRVYLRTQEAIGTGLLLFTVLVTLVNVAMRYGFSASIVWADESARLAFIWMTFLAGALAVASNAHLAIDTIVTKAPERLRRVLTWIANLGAVIFFALLLVGGLEQTRLAMGQESPALRLPLGYIYAAVPISAVLMAVNLLGSHVFAPEAPAGEAPGPDGDTQLKEIL